jgi:hypothetical protein
VAATLGGCGPSGPPSVTAVGSLTEVRFDQPTPPSQEAAGHLIAARNEYESFQVVVDAGNPVHGVRVAPVGALLGPGGARIPSSDLAVYREAPYFVGGAGQPPSDEEGEGGSWPDALIPTRDALYGERRNAFPVDIPRGGKAIAWVDVFVPADQRPGRYAGAIVVTDSEGRIGRVPISLRVLPFGLRSTSGLENSFGFEWTAVCQAQTGSKTCHRDRRLAWLFASLYARLALDDRVTISDPFPMGHGEAPTSSRDRELFRRYILPLIDGDDPSSKLRGARLTSIDAYWGCVRDGGSGPANPGCLRAWRRLAERDGFADRFFVYACDEPGQSRTAWARCSEAAGQAARLWPGVRAMVAASIAEATRFGGAPGDPGAALRKVGTLTPIVNDMANRPGTEYEGDRREGYDAFLSGAYGAPGTPAKRLWLYTSCQSYGCEGDESDPLASTGWPGYAIDEPPSQARAMGWLAFEYRASGELYYQTTSLLPDAWTDSYRSGGNGDGTLFYPGLPAGGDGIPAIGGRHPIPLESIRLKRIRDGREDYEYLRILSRMGLGGQAREVVESLFGPPATAMYGATVSEASLTAARRRLAAMIVGGE